MTLGVSATGTAVRSWPLGVRVDLGTVREAPAVRGASENDRRG